MTKMCATPLPPPSLPADMTKMSSSLSQESKQYATRAKDLHRQVGVRVHVRLRP